MITAPYVRTMAAYNKEMNRRLFDAAARLTDEERRRDRGAFWHSLHGTLNHLLYGDLAWMSRFAGWPPPPVSLKQSDALYADFAPLRAARIETDARIVAWAAGVTDAWLAGTMRWFSNSAQREFVMPHWFLVTHLFNHETHHRGQAHALVTAAGQDTGDTDLFLLVPPDLA